VIRGKYFYCGFTCGQFFIEHRDLQPIKDYVALLIYPMFSENRAWLIGNFPAFALLSFWKEYGALVE
jgi:hypothetical protein